MEIIQKKHRFLASYRGLDWQATSWTTLICYVFTMTLNSVHSPAYCMLGSSAHQSLSIRNTALYQMPMQRTLTDKPSEECRTNIHLDTLTYVWLFAVVAV